MLTESLQGFIQNLSFHSAILLLMSLFVCLGATDKIRGNKGGYGQAFDEGFLAMGRIAPAIIGMRSVAPVIGVLCGSLFTGSRFGISPAAVSSLFLASDAGGYPLALELAGGDTAVGVFTGLIVGSTMGCVITFNIPVALAIIRKEDRPFLACGILIGVITAPVGCFLGGLAMDLTAYKISTGAILINLLPMVAAACLIAAGLWFKTDWTMRAFVKIGKGIGAAIAVCVMIAVFQQLTGIRLPLFYLMVAEDANGISPLMDSLLIVGNIALILIGAFPMVEWLKRRLRKLISFLHIKLRINEEAFAGLIANLANNLPVYHSLHKMDGKGKLLNAAFASCACFVFGDHLGYVAKVDQKMILPLIAAKLACGIAALILSGLLSDRMLFQIRYEHGA